ncbi:MAG: squalene/phytoene synthase family protein [Pseudomonadota bacterium]
MSFDADIAACAALTQNGDPERFAATMALAVPARAKLFPLWAFNIEVSRAPWVAKEPMIAEMRLQWWRDALEEIATGRRVRRHEVVTPLSPLLTPALARTLDALVAARRADIEKAPFDDEATMWTYLEATSSGLFWVAASLLGADDAEEPAVRQCARAIGFANWLRALPELEARGKRPMPDGRPETLARLARIALPELAAQKGLSRSARHAMLAGFMSRPVLRQVARSPGLVAANRLHISPLARSLTLISARLTGRI